jgi:hypothetical protein
MQTYGGRRSGSRRWLLLPLVLGLAALVLSGYSVVRALSLTTGGKVAMGQVTTVRSDRQYRVVTVRYTPPGGREIEFTDRIKNPDGVTISFGGEKPGYPRTYTAGTQVAVLYRPDNPQEARVDLADRGRFYEDSVGGIFFGLLFVGVAVFLLIPGLGPALLAWISTRLAAGRANRPAA